MKPVLLPIAEHLGRLALRRRGVVSRSVSTPLGDLHVYDAPGTGDLPTTVLLHGLGSAATPFGPMLASLQRHVRRVVAPDYPGHGFSADARRARLSPEALFESVASALDAVVDEPAIFVGNSLGGALALKYALSRPSRVHSLVLVSPAGARASDGEWHDIKRAFDLSSRAEATAFLRRLYHRPRWFLPLFAHEVPASLGRRAVRELLATASNDDAPSPEAVRSLPMPVMLLWGKSERLLPEAHFEYFARHLPEHAVIDRPEGFGHCPHIDAPAALAKCVVEFARKASRDAATRVGSDGARPLTHETRKG